VLPLQIFPDLRGGDDLRDVEGHFEQVGGILAVEVGVEIVLLLGLLQPLYERKALFPILLFPISPVALRFGLLEGWKTGFLEKNQSRRSKMSPYG